MSNCLRCGVEFVNSVPEVSNPNGNLEIMCDEWCPECNCAAFLLHREGSAYRLGKGFKQHIYCKEEELETWWRHYQKMK